MLDIVIVAPRQIGFVVSGVAHIKRWRQVVHS
jgi:hypothetical protein